VYPERAPGAEPLPVGALLTHVLPTLAQVPVPLLEWLARYVDYIDPAASVIAPPFFAFWPFPLPRLFPPPQLVRFTGEVVTTAQIIAEFLRQAGFIDEDLS
jgi:hypothetical protein